MISGGSPPTPLPTRNGTGLQQIINLQNATLQGVSTPSNIMGDFTINHGLNVRGGAAVVPTIAVGTGAGTGGAAIFTDTVNVNDMLMHFVQVTTGTAPNTSAKLCTVTFGTVYHEILGDGVYCLFMPQGFKRSELGLYSPGNVNTNPSSIDIWATWTPAASHTYAFGVAVLSK